MSFKDMTTSNINLQTINYEPYVPSPDPTAGKGLLYSNEDAIVAINPGTTGQILVQGSLAPEWQDVDDALPDPLVVKDISFSGDSSYAAYLSSYLEWSSTTFTFFQDSDLSDVIFVSPRTSFVKVGNLVTFTIQGQISNSNNFSGDDYMQSTVLPSQFQPLTNSNGITDLCVFSWTLNNGTANNNAVLRYRFSDSRLIIQNCTNSSGNFNGGDAFNITGISGSYLLI